MLAFYGCLLLITPAFSGLIRGRLPIEISTRGARFAEETNRATAVDEVTLGELEEAISDVSLAIATAQIEISQLSSVVSKDNTQREVDSKR